MNILSRMILGACLVFMVLSRDTLAFSFEEYGEQNPRIHFQYVFAGDGGDVQVDVDVEITSPAFLDSFLLNTADTTFSLIQNDTVFIARIESAETTINAAVEHSPGLARFLSSLEDLVMKLVTDASCSLHGEYPLSPQKTVFRFPFGTVTIRFTPVPHSDRSTS